MWKKVEMPVLGLVENMSGYVCPSCGHHEEIFLRGGGRKLAERAGIPFLGEIPLQPAVSRAGDEGTPIVLREPGVEGRRDLRRHRVRRRLQPVGAQRPGAGRRQAQLEADADSLGDAAPGTVARRMGLLRRFACAAVACLALAACEQPPERARADAATRALPVGGRGAAVRRRPTTDGGAAATRGRPGRRRGHADGGDVAAPLQHRRPARHAVLLVELPRPLRRADRLDRRRARGRQRRLRPPRGRHRRRRHRRRSGCARTTACTCSTASCRTCCRPGNHDYCCGGWPTDRTTTMINGYFPVSTFSSRPSFKGTFEADRIENSAHLLDVPGGAGQWLVLSLEFGPRDTVLAWADDVAKQYADTPAMRAHARVPLRRRHPLRPRRAPGSSSGTRTAIRSARTPGDAQRRRGDVAEAGARQQQHQASCCRATCSTAAWAGCRARGRTARWCTRSCANYQNYDRGGDALPARAAVLPGAAHGPRADVLAGRSAP